MTLTDRRFFLVAFVVTFLIVTGVLAWGMIYRRLTHFPAGTLPEEKAENETATPLLPPRRAEDPIRGSSDPQAVEVVLFSNLSCFYCRTLAADLKNLSQQNNPPIRLVWRDLTLPGEQPGVILTALAGRCAREQEKFWEMHDALLAMDNFDLNVLNNTAKKLGLSKSTFEQCLSSGKHLVSLQQDAALAAKHQIIISPTLFIDGEPLTGFVRKEDLERRLQRAARRR